MKPRFESVNPRAQRRDGFGQVAQQPQRREWLTSDEAIAHLGLRTKSALYYHIRENRLPHGRLGRSYRFDRAAIDRWLASVGGVLPLSQVG